MNRYLVISDEKPNLVHFDIVLADTPQEALKKLIRSRKKVTHVTLLTTEEVCLIRRAMLFKDDVELERAFERHTRSKR